jgi:predicted PhzF superfamily epimerase YddE/YHI9
MIADLTLRAFVEASRLPSVTWEQSGNSAEKVPDYEAPWKLCDQFRVTGLYPFTRQTDKTNAQVETRQFPQRAGFPEDAATGVAAALVSACLTFVIIGCKIGAQ